MNKQVLRILEKGIGTSNLATGRQNAESQQDAKGNPGQGNKRTQRERKGKRSEKKSGQENEDTQRV